MRTPTPAEVIQAVDYATGDFTMAMLCGTDMTPRAAEARQVWGYLVRLWTPHSYAALRGFTGRSQTQLRAWAYRRGWSGVEWGIIDRANQWLLSRYRMPTGLERGVRLCA